MIKTSAGQCAAATVVVGAPLSRKNKVMKAKV